MKLSNLTALLSLLVLSGCAYLPSGTPQRVQSAAPQNLHAARDASALEPGQAEYKRGPGFVNPKLQPYSIMGKTYWPVQSALGYNEVGNASWYGIDFHGKKTATGEVYDMFGVSAAHKTLPLGTKVRVTNLENGRELELMVNDRGPFVDGRIIDLSYASARLLGMADKGVAKVRVVGIGENPALAGGSVNAMAVASAEAPARRTRQQPVERTIVEEPARPQAQPMLAWTKEKRPLALSDASRPEAPGVQASRTTRVADRTESGRFAVQVGAFSQDENARRVQARLMQAGFGGARITRVQRGGKEFLAVQAGAFEHREKAEEALRSLKLEFPASFISSGA